MPVASWRVVRRFLDSSFHPPTGPLDRPGSPGDGTREDEKMSRCAARHGGRFAARVASPPVSRRARRRRMSRTRPGPPPRPPRPPRPRPLLLVFAREPAADPPLGLGGRDLRRETRDAAAARQNNLGEVLRRETRDAAAAPARTISASSCGERRETPRRRPPGHLSEVFAVTNCHPLPRGRSAAGRRDLRRVEQLDRLARGGCCS